MSRAPHPKLNQKLYNQGSSAGSNSNTAAGRVNAPAIIKCYVCGRDKPQSQYSARQLTKWKASIYSPYAPKGKISGDPRTTCKSCTPDQVTELTCIVCGETNGLNYFAKTQRKNPDRARCKTCINKQADTAPDLEVPDSDEYVSSDSGDNGDFDTGKKEEKTNTVVRGSGSTHYTESNADETNPNSLTLKNLNLLDTTGASKRTNDGWVTKGRKPAEADSDDSEDFDTASMSKTENSRSGRSRASAKPSVVETRRNGWAKVEKIKKQPTKAYDSDDDDDDDDDDDLDSNATGWTDRTPKVKSDFDADPWARYYR